LFTPPRRSFHSRRGVLAKFYQILLAPPRRFLPPTAQMIIQ